MILCGEIPKQKHPKQKHVRLDFDVRSLYPLSMRKPRVGLRDNTSYGF